MSRKIDYRAIGPISAAAPIQIVDLVESDWQSLARSDDARAQTISLSVSRARMVWALDSTGTKRLEVHVPFFVNGKSPDGSFPIFKLKMGWRLVYDITNLVMSDYDDETISDFAFTSAQLTAFPYVRQYVNDICMRAGFQGVVLAPILAAQEREDGMVGRFHGNADGDTPAERKIPPAVNTKSKARRKSSR